MRRVDIEASEQESRELWGSPFPLFNFRLLPDRVSELLEGVRPLKESSTYRWLFAEDKNGGRNEGERALCIATVKAWDDLLTPRAVHD